MLSSHPLTTLPAGPVHILDSCAAAWAAALKVCARALLIWQLGQCWRLTACRQPCHAAVEATACAALLPLLSLTPAGLLQAPEYQPAGAARGRAGPAKRKPGKGGRGVARGRSSAAARATGQARAVHAVQGATLPPTTTKALAAPCLVCLARRFSSRLPAAQRCANCGVTSTPAWRRFGQQLLCNACGLRKSRGSRL